MTRIALINDDEGSKWDDYVVPRASGITDVYAWRRVVREAYGIRSTFLAAKDGDRIVGALGIYQIKHPIFGHYLTTAVFGNDGGFYFDNDDARTLLIHEAQKLADNLDASYLVIRSRGVELDGFRISRDYLTAVVSLEGGADALWKRLPAKTRNQVRRGMKEGFTIETGRDQLGAFFDVFHEHMRDLGSPAHSRRYYEKIIEHLGERAQFLVVRDGNEVAAGALLCSVGRIAMNLHTVSLRRYNQRCPNYFLYWRMMESSCQSGQEYFDMGRSRAESPQLKFKSNWNPAEITLIYNYFLRTMKDLPDIDPRNPKYRLQIALWQKMPLLVTKALGPRLIPGLA